MHESAYQSLDLPFAYVPFAMGPRVCLGKQFAMMEMRIVLGTLIQNVDVNILEGFEPDPASAASVAAQKAVYLARLLQARAGELQTPQERKQQAELDFSAAGKPRRKAAAKKSPSKADAAPARRGDGRS